jgi:hypothetical protein
MLVANGGNICHRLPINMVLDLSFLINQLSIIVIWPSKWVNTFKITDSWFITKTLLLGAVWCGSLFEGLTSLTCRYEWSKVDTIILHDSDRRSVTPYGHGMSCIAMCVLQTKVELTWKDLKRSERTWSKSTATRSLYSTEPDSYMQTQSLAGGPGVVNTLLQQLWRYS